MDDTTVMYGQPRFDEIKAEVSGYLKKVRYNYLSMLVPSRY